MDTAGDEIMEATYRALCEHGYADLTMQRIADESSVSKAALHYHYDTKTELLRAFLEYAADRFEAELATDSDDPVERIRAIVATLFDRDEDGGAYATALLEIKAQAPYDEVYRERLRALDERVRERVAAAVRDGLERGVFEDADPEATARFVATAMNGAHVREVALGESPDETRALVASSLESELGIAVAEVPA